MRAGRLRHRVTIQERTGDANAYNEPADTWTDVVTLSAGVEPISGREFFASQQVHGTVSHRITLRYYAGVTIKHRVKWTDPATSVARIFDINAVIDRDERHRSLELMCTEHV